MKATGTTRVPTLREARYSQSLERGLAILQCFTSGAERLGIADLADSLGMARPTTHRYVTTLVALGFIEQPANGGRKYRLGPRAQEFGLSALNSRPLRRAARPQLQRLRTETLFTASVAVLDGDLLIIDRLQGYRGHAQLKVNIGVGTRLPIYCTSMGKVLLAHLPSKELDEALGGVVFQRWGPNTIRTKGALRTELREIRTAGFAVDDEELTKGARAIAVPLQAKTGKVVAALEVAAPAALIERCQMVERCGPKLLDASERLAAELVEDEPPINQAAGRADRGARRGDGDD